MIRTESDYLDAVAHYIETHGWLQRRFNDGEGNVCLRAAMTEVGTRQMELARWSLIVGGALYRIRAAVGHEIRWNDEPGRIKQHVLDLLRRLAKDARKEEEARDAR